jgi:hypothetical protein
MSDILSDSSNVIGHIYLITNKESGKSYVGQTLSHRKNKGKYRPFGYEGRFKDHISEAICNSKKKQCTYLNNAIRLYGKDAFEISLITTCLKSDLDALEEHYITEYNTLYPNGYNLTKGGKVFKTITTDDIEETYPLNTPIKRGGCAHRTLETRTKMSQRLKELMGTDEARLDQMKRSQKQHSENKLRKFNGMAIDSNNLDKYISVINSDKHSQYIRVSIAGKRTTFVGKYETIEQLKEKAIMFLKSINSSATLPNCSGNP